MRIVWEEHNGHGEGGENDDNDVKKEKNMILEVSYEEAVRAI